MNDLKYWVAFHQISGIGPATFTKLESRFGNLEDAWRAPLSDLVAAGVSRKAAGEAERFSDENGALFTEYPPGVSALPKHFPRRNRVTNGLCQGVLVVETAFKSDAMITVNWAMSKIETYSLCRAVRSVKREKVPTG